MKLNDKQFNYYLGQRIQQIRQDKGIKQEELANALGFSRMALSTYESGRSKFTVYQLMLTAEILNVPFSWFLPDDLSKTQIIKPKRESYEVNTEEDIEFTLEMSLRTFLMSKGIKKKNVREKVEKALKLIENLSQDS